MKSQIIIALVVFVAVAGHVAIYRWVKFKIQEGVILQFLRDALRGGSAGHHDANTIAENTGISSRRVAVICQKSAAIHSDPKLHNCWRADQLSV